MDNVQEKNWYQYPWVWVIVSIPFSAVAFGILMFVMADISRDDLVVDDYYRDGMAINRQLDMDREAKSLDIHASLQQVREHLLAFRIDNATDSAVRLNLYHVASREEDRSTVLVPEDPGGYTATDPAVTAILMSQGVWYVELIGADTHWRLRKRIVTPLNRLELSP